ncbi:S-layer homology domain-containing protein [Acutalibacter sp. 1XD8-33]|uniref:S-layer homology domain-containing protein n=1 Tax=Acutalibacter sp. 1XD8-33 TaxID=2320081 RepID=UPI001313E379|nr:S-layer homology domain-containing protein [Acutalibacter sp. 1XD8-33]
MKKKLLSFLLALILVLGMLPLAASAGGWFRLYVFKEDGVWYQVPNQGGGTKVSNQGKGWEWDPVTKTLTLHNASFKSSSGGIQFCDGATIRMDEGSVNTLSGRSLGDLEAKGDLTILGKGTLEVISQDAGTGAIRIGGKAVIQQGTIIAGTSFSCNGLELADGSVSCNSFSAGSVYKDNPSSIINSSVSIEGWSFTSSGKEEYRGSFYAGNMTVESSTITAHNLGDSIWIGDLSAVDSSIILERHPACLTPEALGEYFHYTPGSENQGPSFSFTSGKIWIDTQNLRLDHSSLSSNVHVKCEGLPSLKNTQGGKIAVANGDFYVVSPDVAENYLGYMQDVATGSREMGPIEITPSDPKPIIPMGSKFQDVKPGQWYTPAVQYAYENGLMTGTSAKQFGLNSTISRAQLLTILYRQEGEMEIAADSGTDTAFSDVKAGDWFAKEVKWAALCGIVHPYNNHPLKPNASLTRAEFAEIMFQYALVKNDTSWRDFPDEESINSQLSSFIDEKELRYGRQAMAWAVSKGIIRGSSTKDGQKLNPLGTIKRSEAATIFMRFFQGESVPSSLE